MRQENVVTFVMPEEYGNTSRGTTTPACNCICSQGISTAQGIYCLSGSAFGCAPNLSDAVGKSNNDVGGRLVEFTGREYMVRGRGYIRSLDDIRKTVIMANAQTGTPVLVGDVATVTFGPDMRRGAGELDGEGEAVGGVVIMRYGENAQKVIERTKEKLHDLKSTLPPGVKLVKTYDRSELIDRAVDNLRHTLIEELVIFSLVIMIFLWDLRSAIVPIITIPVTVILAFIPMQWMGMTANIMSLGGLAVTIGALADASVVMVEQTHKKLEHREAEGRPGPSHAVVIAAMKEVGGPSFFALLVIAVGFLPVFTLEGHGGRLFKPLAFTKNFSMAIAAILAITLAPAAMRFLFSRMDGFNFRPAWLAKTVHAIFVGKIHSEDNHPTQQADDEALSSSGRVCSRSQVANHRCCLAGHGTQYSCVFQTGVRIHATAK